ncbi:MAG TPA: M28 family peptidase, partial [Flavisolibacter sp.]|nr:M28 family peptidase [Flavisolibacter sp.]
MIKVLCCVCSFITVSGVAQKVQVSADIQKAMNRIDTNTIRSHIAYLADDKLKGRLPGTEGYQMAVDYVTGQLKQIGIAPGGDNGAYTQKLIIRKAILNNASPVAILKDAAGNSDSLVFIKDFVPTPHPLKTQTSAEGSLVFVGYGVDVPGGYSDYKDVNVKGKIVVLVNGAPPGLQSTLTAHFSNVGNKLNTAFQRGAAGAITIDLNARPSSVAAPVFQYNVALNPAKTEAYSRRFAGALQMVLTGNQSLLRRLFLNSGKNLEQVLAGMKGGKPSSFALPYSITASHTTTHSDFESYNVVGLIPGSDAKLKGEYVVHSAHLDHLGIGKPVNGDSIYNGAHDNASGIASLLEIARIYKTSNAKPKRSVLIVMVTGEEMGL